MSRNPRARLALAMVGLGLAGLLQSSAALGQPAPSVDPSLRQGVGASAVEAFVEGDPAEAARRYQVLLETRGPSADLLYDLGTAWGHAGSFGRAIWALERARLRAPRDEAIAHNLDVMRQRVRVNRMEQMTSQKLTEGEPDGVFWFRALTWIGEGELGLLVVILNLLTFGLLAVRRLMREGGAKDGATVVAGLLAVALLVALGLAIAQAAVIDQVRVGVVLEPDLQLYGAPSRTAGHEGHPDLYSGATVRVVEQRDDGWTRVRVVDDSTGWVRTGEIGVVQ